MFNVSSSSTLVIKLSLWASQGSANHNTPFEIKLQNVVRKRLCKRNNTIDARIYIVTNFLQWQWQRQLTTYGFRNISKKERD